MAEEYHFRQPNVPAPKKIFQPVESQLNGYLAVAWRTSINGIIAKKNHVEAVITSSGTEYNKATDDIATVQFQNRWDVNNGLNAWQGTKYGYGPNDVRLSLGAMISIPENTGGAIGYSTLYLRGIEIISKIRYWLQFSLYDERGPLPDNFYMDIGLTGEPAFTGSMGSSSYFSIIPTSSSVTKNVFSDLRFFGVSVSRQQLWNIMMVFRSKLKVNISPEPNLHRIFACGMTPELGLADPGGTMKFVGENMFLRTDFPNVSLLINKLVFIDSAWKPGQRINTETELVCSTIKDGAWSAHWMLNQVPGTPYFWIENRWRTGQRLNVESGKLTSSLIHDGGWSAHWEFVPVGSSYRIQNRWISGHRIHIANGKLESGQLSDEAPGAKWNLQPV